MLGVVCWLLIFNYFYNNLLIYKMMKKLLVYLTLLIGIFSFAQSMILFAVNGLERHKFKTSTRLKAYCPAATVTSAGRRTRSAIR